MLCLMCTCGNQCLVKEGGVGNQVVYAVVVHCAMQHRVRKGNR
jgi:hypothetical protein